MAYPSSLAFSLLVLSLPPFFLLSPATPFFSLIHPPPLGLFLSCHLHCEEHPQFPLSLGCVSRAGETSSGGAARRIEKHNMLDGIQIDATGGA